MTEYYFQAYTKESVKPITLWVIANNQMAARTQIMKLNPFITRLIFIRSKRVQ